MPTLTEPEPPRPDAPRRFGKYELLELIGTGGMAEIFRARAPNDGDAPQILVVKKILPEYAQNRAFVNMLIAEAKVTSLLDHPNIVQIYELGDIDGQHYIAMELVDGADLLDVLARCTHDKLRVPTELALHIVAEVCKGLAHAHSATDAAGRPLNIIHRDVSPSNILLGLNGAVKVMDFGVATADLGRDVTFDPTQLSLKGKLGYLSPEQVMGHPIDRRSDVFALGIILFESLTLKRLFLGKTDIQTIINVREANVERKFKRHSYIPAPIRAILQRALARDPAHRYPTATDMQEAILDYLFESRLRVTSRTLATFLRQVLHPPDVPPETPSIPSRPVPRPTLPEPPPGPQQPPGPIPELPADAHARPPLPRDLRRVDLSRASRVLRVDGEPPFGPLDRDRFTALLAARAVGPREWVSINGSDWIRTSDVAAIVELHPALFDDESDRPLFDGPVHRLRTPRLYHQIAAASLGGKLKLTRGPVHKEIYFDAGRPVLAHSNLKSELLGAVLLRSGLLPPDQIDRALTLEPRALLGTSLVRTGALDPQLVARALAEQLLERLIEPFTWTHGWYEFFAGVLPPRPPPPLPFSPHALVMQGLRAHFDLGSLRRAFDPYLDRPLVLAPDLPTRLAPLDLAPNERVAAASLRPNATLSQLLSSPNADGDGRLHLLRAAFAAFHLDALTFRTAHAP